MGEEIGRKISFCLFFPAWYGYPDHGVFLICIEHCSFGDDPWLGVVYFEKVDWFVVLARGKGVLSAVLFLLLHFAGRWSWLW